MEKVILFILFSSVIFCCQAQSFDIKIFDGRIKETKQQVKDRVREYKRVKKEYKKYIRQRRKQYRAIKDSVQSLDGLKVEIPQDSLKQLGKTQKEYFVYTDSHYSLKEIATWEHVKKKAKNKGMALAKEKLNGNRYLSRYKNLKNQISSYRKELRIYKDSLKSIDSLDREDIRYLVDQKKQELSKEYEGKMESITREIVNKKAPDLPGGFENEELAQFKETHKQLKNGQNKDGLLKLSKAQSIDHFKDKQEVLKKAKSEVAKLKKKYSEVKDLKDLSSATKINTLKDKPLGQRLVFGGTFQLHVDQNTKVDLNPEVNYRLNKKLEAGIGGTYRLTVATKELPHAVEQPKVMGFRGFLEHHLIKNFYVHGEYEALQSKIQQNDRQSTKEWYSSFLAGIERRFKLRGKVQGQAQVLYNFNSNDNPLYGSPWVFRVGINLTDVR